MHVRIKVRKVRQAHPVYEEMCANNGDYGPEFVIADQDL